MGPGGMRRLAIATAVLMINLVGSLCSVAPANADPAFPDIDSLPMASIKYPAGFDPTDGKQWPIENIFSPADGVYCRLRLQAWGTFQMPPADVACAGELPGMSNGENIARIDIGTSGAPYARFLKGSNSLGDLNTYPHFSAGKQLQVFLNTRSILMSCGSGNGDDFIFACHAWQSLGQADFPPHGFVLAASGSWVF